MLIKNKKEQETYRQAYEKEKLKQLALKEERRSKQIQEQAREKAKHKYGMTRQDKIAYYIKKFNDGVIRARKQVQWLQEDLERDLEREKHQ